MAPFVCCLAGAAFSYFIGVKMPGAGYGTIAGWLLSLATGVILGLLYYMFSAYGLLFSLESLESLF